MPEVLVRVSRTSHWDAILPVIPWLAQAGVEVVGTYSGMRPPKAELAGLAQSLDQPAPSVSWKRAHSSRGRLVLTSTDDLTLSLADEVGGFLALPRLPVPVTVFPPDPPTAVRVAIEALSRSGAAALIHASHPHRLLDLPERLGGLPHALTGVPLLDGRCPLLDPKTVVVLTDAEVWTAKRRARKGLEREAVRLERVLSPLFDTDFALEVHTIDASLAPNAGAALRDSIGDITKRAQVAHDRVRVRTRPVWRALPSSVAILAVSYVGFACALAAGVSGVWWVQLGARGTRTQEDRTDRIDRHVLYDEDDYLGWIKRQGWREPSACSEAISELVLELRDGDATQRVAQLVLAAITQ